MYLSDSLLDLVLKRCSVEYRGLHSSGGWPSRAYYMLSVEGKSLSSCKVVTQPIKAKQPKQATLDKALRAELRRRFDAVQVLVETDHYGQVQQPRIIDPHGVLPLLQTISGNYVYLMMKGKQ